VDLLIWRRRLGVGGVGGDTCGGVGRLDAEVSARQKVIHVLLAAAQKERQVAAVAAVAAAFLPRVHQLSPALRANVWEVVARLLRAYEQFAVQLVLAEAV
jgi:hypothetical protein